MIWLVVADYECHMVFGDLALEGAAVHPGLVKAVLLVGLGVVAEFASERRLLVAVFAEELPGRVIIVVMRAAHEGVVEVAELLVQESRLLHEWRVCLVGGIDGNAPRSILEPLLHVAYEFSLKDL